MKGLKQFILNNHFANLLELEKETNGRTDSEQVIIYKKDGVEMFRSEGGKHTISSPEFKKLIIEKINELYE